MTSTAAIRGTTATAALLIWPLVWLASCGPSPREGGFDAAVPSARLDAISAADRTWKRDRVLPPIAIRQGLVECLRSDDDLVRFAAIGALRDMTGGDRGYRYDDALALRELAIDQWIPWAGSPSQDASQSPAKGEPQIVAREAAR